jgi:hypothetical protein
MFTRAAKWRQLSVMPTSSRCLLGIMKMCSRITPALCAAWPGPVRSKPLILRNYRIAESPNRRGAHFAESSSREARPRDSARFDQPWGGEPKEGGRGGESRVPSVPSSVAMNSSAAREGHWGAGCPCCSHHRRVDPRERNAFPGKLPRQQPRAHPCQHACMVLRIGAAIAEPPPGRAAPCRRCTPWRWRRRRDG